MLTLVLLFLLLSPSEVKASAQAVVEIPGVGLGVRTGPSVITLAAHEVRGLSEIQTSVGPGRVLSRDEKKDVATLTVPEVSGIWAPVAKNLPEDNEQVWIVVKLGDDLKIIQGQWLGMTHLGGEQRWVALLPIFYGDSGGPVFNSKGELFAVTRGGWVRSANVNYLEKPIELAFAQFYALLNPVVRGK